LLTSSKVTKQTNEDIMSKQAKNTKTANLTTPKVASRVQTSVAGATGGVIAKGAYVGRLQRAAAGHFGKSGANSGGK
jgi:hypothetical protein